MLPTNKKKIVNDPVHGFINISYPLAFDIIEHPYFQRLRHIKQLGLTYLVYPGANHSRFQHALGAMHLMELAIGVLRAKGHTITDEEAEAASAAILLHDIGHGPFSHSLEYSLIQGVSHEDIGRGIMRKLNLQMGGRLDMAIEIFKGTYSKNFLHQLVSSQLDVDRLDYLRRDSFFSGVTEGAIGSDRIIKMLNVVDDNLVVDAKGIYSIEKFIIARRLMYWQVYLHKTVVSAEKLLTQLLSRGRQLALAGEQLWCTPALSFFLSNQISPSLQAEVDLSSEVIDHYVKIDDSDIMVAAKQWQNHPDATLSTLATMVTNRQLFKVELRNNEFTLDEVAAKQSSFEKLNPKIAEYSHFFVFTGSVSNNAYRMSEESIKILYNNGALVDIASASDMINTKILSKEITKYFLCYPK
ncbi:HD domain-containing protein [Perlabentimonas gracilis]|uniref:HD domain-containing protein n=1 Tax=Perlabentimonas gracilis TaxID=2715279 RepID=UPI00140D152A|nr:HD domain-containing protein [Perlabentimonas gracilis]NHB69333.1 HD domain-containing protein [Perlabentimonas gracilis]